MYDKPPYTPAMREVLGFSKAEAGRLGHDYIGPEHFLLGIIRKGDGLAVQTFHNLDVDLSELKNEIERSLEIAKSPTGGVIVPNREAKRVLEAACNIAITLKHGWIGTEHLLLGLIKEEATLPSKIIHSRGVDFERAEREVLDVIEGVDAALKPKDHGLQEMGNAAAKIEEKRIGGDGMAKRLKYFVNNEWLESKTDKYMPIYNPSTGEVIAETPRCTVDEVNAAVQAAKEAFPSWSDTPPPKRIQVLFNFKRLLDEHLEELASILSTEMGKTHTEARGSVERGIEIVEFACGIPTLMMGESLENVSKNIDVVTYRQPLGVCVGIVPFNFPAMIPMWMFPLAIACGNTFVLKAASMVPQTAMRLMELLVEAGMPKGVLNLLTCGRESVKILLEHPDVKAISFVGSTSTGLYIYETAARSGKRVQALTEAKNHCLVLPDCLLERTARGIVNATFGCAGERCMALPVAVVHNKIAEELVALIVKLAKQVKVGYADSPDTQMGPLVSQDHREGVIQYIEKGVEEGAELVLDGRGCTVKDYPNGFYLGPTVFDKVTQDMVVGREEIFGPVLCIKRAASFEEGLRIINESEFGNGAAIYTRSGYYAREFARRVGAGMVGINVGIPVPLGFFSFTGWKRSFFGDLHSHGKDGVLFYTEKKSVTYRWFSEEEAKVKKVSTWD